jgi:hypothetical protein
MSNEFKDTVRQPPEEMWEKLPLPESETPRLSAENLSEQMIQNGFLTLDKGSLVMLTVGDSRFKAELGEELQTRLEYQDTSKGGGSQLYLRVSSDTVRQADKMIEENDKFLRTLRQRVKLITSGAIRKTVIDMHRGKEPTAGETVTAVFENIIDPINQQKKTEKRDEITRLSREVLKNCKTDQPLDSAALGFDIDGNTNFGITVEVFTDGLVHTEKTPENLIKYGKK